MADGRQYVLLEVITSDDPACAHDGPPGEWNWDTLADMGSGSATVVWASDWRDKK